MNYELAKQLKDAGFPLKWSLVPGEVYTREAHVPTLSELIEACGLGFYTLINNLNSKWSAVRDDRSHYVGTTPEEAVAKLWLALNNKNGNQPE